MFKNISGIGIFHRQEKWAIFIVADALAPPIASSSVAMELTKFDKWPDPCIQRVTNMRAHDCSLADII